MEKKHIKDLLPNIIKQLGPKQFSFMKDFAETLKNADKQNTMTIGNMPFQYIQTLF